MSKKFLSAAAAAIFATMGIATAQAGTLDSVAGDVRFRFIGWHGSQNSYNANCSTEASCDAQSIANGGEAGAFGANSGDDFWGYSNLTPIEPADGGGSLFSAGDDGDYLIAYFHEFRDVSVNIITADIGLFKSDFGVVDIYRVDLAKSLEIAAAMNLSGAGQNALEAAIDIDTADLFLHLEFYGNCDDSGTGSFCSSFFNSIGDYGNGVASGTAKVVAPGDGNGDGGSAGAKFPFDFEFLQNTTRCDFGENDANENCDSVNLNSNFNFFMDGSAITTALPEPGALGLLGIGLLGLGLAGRRRKA